MKTSDKANWGERERAPTLLMSMEIVYVRTYVRPARPRSTATLRMRERCSNSADLAGFRNQQLFLSGPGNVSTRGQVIDINRSPKIEIPRLCKGQHSAPGSLSQLSPREAKAERLYEMAMTALPIQPIPVCVALLKGRLRHGCYTESLLAGCI